MSDKPKITVVTVCFNCRDVIERTICNVLKQTYGNVEYIVIDGGSTDGTKEIVDRYRDRLAYYVSEPDKGIYDAMNKGIRAASGDWILFRNAGDYFFKSTTIEDVFSWYEDHGEAVIAGGMRCFGQDGYRDRFYTGRGVDVWHRAFIPHPSAFIRMSVQRANPYSTAYRIGSDYRLFQKLMLEGASVAIYDGIVSLFDCECGISSQHKAMSWNDILQIREELGAPREVVRATKRNCRRIKITSAVIRLLKLKSRNHGAGWTKQPMEETLKDIS